MGAEDYSSNMGVERTKSNKEIEFARFTLATCAKAFEVDSIDTPYTDVEDFDGLIKDTTFAKSIGLSGRLLINPRQVEYVHKVLSPTEEEIEEASAILQKADEAKKKVWVCSHIREKWLTYQLSKERKIQLITLRNGGF